MKIEHVAYQVEDPRAFAQWYAEHLGLTIKRVQTEPPFGHFLADDGGTVMVEVYRIPEIPVPDYAGTDPFVLHVAFTATDIAATRERLIRAGATAVGDIASNPAGDQVAMLRDPWGLAVQLVRRATPMIG